MFTVTTPYKYASAMFRLTSLGMQMQMSTYRALSGVPVGSAGKVSEQVQKSSQRPKSRKKSTAAAQAKPTVKQRGKQTGKRTRKPSKPPALPEVTSEKAEDGLNNMPV